LLGAAEYDVFAAAVVRSVAADLDVDWPALCRAADTIIEEIEDEIEDERLAEGGAMAERLSAKEPRVHCAEVLGELAALQPLRLPSAVGGGPFLLESVSTRRGAHVFVGVSGLLSHYEGDMRLSASPRQLCACWEAAASFVGSGGWWSLRWGTSQLEGLALAQQRLGLRHGTEPRAEVLGPLRGVASFGHALALHSSWGGCYEEAKAAGAALAAFLLRRGAGVRPVSLLGVSLGARVVWHCLECLAEDEHGFGCVHHVLLLAAPVTVNAARWERLRAVVAGRLVNAYVPGNVQLGALYRSDHWTSKGCCGLSGVDSPLVENFDATSHVASDSDAYHFAVPAVVEALRLC